MTPFEESLILTRLLKQPEIDVALQQTQHAPIPVLSRDGEAAILAWLAAIGETDLVTIGEVIDSCRSDAEARAYFIGRAVMELPKSKG